MLCVVCGCSLGCAVVGLFDGDVVLLFVGLLLCAAFVVDRCLLRFVNVCCVWLLMLRVVVSCSLFVYDLCRCLMLLLVVVCVIWFVGCW